MESTDSVNRSKPEPGLYIVATPIGNLRDITLRALDILAGADVIACEDTRVTAKLLNAYGIAARTIPYHDHNAARMRPQLIERLNQGEVVALVSDAGTPLVSDPGFKLVRAAREAGIPVYAAPGPSAALAALVSSGLPPDRFTFAGFLPAGQGSRRRAIADLVVLPGTIILYESPGRLAAALADLAAILGDRPAAVARELTKLHEETVAGTLGALAARYAAGPAPKGEVVIVIGPAAAEAPDATALDERLKAALARGSVKDAAAEVAAALGLPRKQVYARALSLAPGGKGKPRRR